MSSPSTSSTFGRLQVRTQERGVSVPAEVGLTPKVKRSIVPPTKTSAMNYSFYVIAAIAIGACVSLQPPINATTAGVLGSPLLAACISISISLMVVVLLWLTWGKGAGQLAQVKALPWWAVIGGIIGVVFVAGGVVVAPVLGVALFFVCIVAGQLLGSIVADHVGAFGVQVRPVNLMKVLGFGLVLAGAALVRNSNS